MEGFSFFIHMDFYFFDKAHASNCYYKSRNNAGAILVIIDEYSSQQGWRNERRIEFVLCLSLSPLLSFFLSIPGLPVAYQSFMMIIVVPISTQPSARQSEKGQKREVEWSWQKLGVARWIATDPWLPSPSSCHRACRFSSKCVSKNNCPRGSLDLCLSVYLFRWYLQWQENNNILLNSLTKEQMSFVQ